MSEHALNYYRERAERELALARAATEDHIRRMHYYEAGRCLDISCRAGLQGGAQAA